MRIDSDDDSEAEALESVICSESDDEESNLSDSDFAGGVTITDVVSVT